MQISNIRYGFATNSSSTHSICFIDDTDIPTNHYFHGSNLYGWDNFTLTHEDDKITYMLVNIYNSLCYHFGETVSTLLMRGLCGYLKDEFSRNEDFSFIVEGSIDHPSSITIPKLNTGSIAIEYCYDLIKLGLMENVVIYGGNDNDEEYVNIASSAKEVSIPKEYPCDRLIARRDLINDIPVWVFFDTVSGFKTRVIMSQKDVEYNKSTYPELVDISITDYCESNCAYCYRGSTTDGKHSEWSHLTTIIYYLHKMGVFEIAIGGGEPTSHPKFVDLLLLCKKYNIVANFTTRNLDWIKNLSWTTFINAFGAFAYSIESAKQIFQLHETLTSVDFPTYKCNIQLVMGVVTKQQFIEIVEACAATNMTLVLLGYKTTHRGSNYDHKKYDWLIDVINDVRSKKYVKIGIDTVLAQQFETELKKANISRLLYSKEEGKFSCFIDAVKMIISPSSFDQTEMSILNKYNYCCEQQIKDAYKNF